MCNTRNRPDLSLSTVAHLCIHIHATLHTHTHTQAHTHTRRHTHHTHTHTHTHTHHTHTHTHTHIQCINLLLLGHWEVIGVVAEQVNIWRKSLELCRTKFAITIWTDTIIASHDLHHVYPWRVTYGPTWAWAGKTTITRRPASCSTSAIVVMSWISSLQVE